jgi:hypothetical protein
MIRVYNYPWAGQINPYDCCLVCGNSGIEYQISSRAGRCVVHFGDHPEQQELREIADEKQERLVRKWCDKHDIDYMKLLKVCGMSTMAPQTNGVLSSMLANQDRIVVRDALRDKIKRMDLISSYCLREGKSGTLLKILDKDAIGHHTQWLAFIFSGLGCHIEVFDCNVGTIRNMIPYSDPTFLQQLEDRAINWMRTNMKVADA